MRDTLIKPALCLAGTANGFESGMFVGKTVLMMSPCGVRSKLADS